MSEPRIAPTPAGAAKQARSAAQAQWWHQAHQLRCTTADELEGWLAEFLLRPYEGGKRTGKAPLLEDFCGDADGAWCAGEALAGRCVRVVE